MKDTKAETVPFANTVVNSSALTWLLKLMFFLNLSWISNYQVLQYSMILLWIAKLFVIVGWYFLKRSVQLLHLQPLYSMFGFFFFFFPLAWRTVECHNKSPDLLKSFTKCEENSIWSNLEMTPLVSYKINFCVSVFFQSWLEDFQYKYLVMGLDL